jgi:hypothetical protein
MFDLYIKVGPVPMQTLDALLRLHQR